MAPIMPLDVKPFLDADSFVFVPITDFEIQLETLRYIKENSNATILFDAHGPTTYINKNGDRLRQYWKDKEAWFAYIDVLKMNLEESHCCWFDVDFNNAVYDDNNTSHLDEFAEYSLNKGIDVLYVTLDSRGCALYTKSKDGNIQKDFIPSIPVKDVIDTTGCGDSFAGGLAYGFNRFKDRGYCRPIRQCLGSTKNPRKRF